MAKGIEFKLQIELMEPIEAIGAINKQVFPLLNQAVRAVAQATAADWQAEIQQAKLWSGERDAYMSSVKWRMTGDFSAVIESDYKHAQGIETGRPAYDLKQMLNSSLKVRRTEKGKRFLVIPMRHNIKKLESAGLYGPAKALEASMVTGQGLRNSGEVTHLSPKTGMSKSAHQTAYLSDPNTKQHMKVKQNHYAWGHRLSKADAGEHKWAQGLVRFNTSTPNGGKSSSYMTFRIMMEGQKGWMLPAQPGQHLVRKVVSKMQPKAQTAFAAAIQKQLNKG